MLPTLPTQKVKRLEQNKIIEIRGACLEDFKDFTSNDSKPKLNYAVTELVDRVSGDLLADLANKLEQESILNPIELLKLKEELPSNLKGCQSEHLPFLSGIIVPACFIFKNDWKRFRELFLPNRLEIFDSLEKKWKKKYKEIQEKSKNDRKSLESKSFHEDLAFLALIHHQAREDLVTRAHQVNISDLAHIVPPKEMELAMCRFKKMKNTCGVNDLKFEYPVETKVETDDITFEVSGEIDAIDFSQGKIFEFKCTNKLEPKHVLQVMMYAYMQDGKGEYPIKEVYLFNVKTQELRSITYEKERVKNIIVRLLEMKRYTPSTQDDEKFIEEANRLAANPEKIELRE